MSQLFLIPLKKKKLTFYLYYYLTYSESNHTQANSYYY